MAHSLIQTLLLSITIKSYVLPVHITIWQTNINALLVKKEPIVLMTEKRLSCVLKGGNVNIQVKKSLMISVKVDMLVIN